MVWDFNTKWLVNHLVFLFGVYNTKCAFFIIFNLSLIYFMNVFFAQLETFSNLCYVYPWWRIRDYFDSLYQIIYYIILFL